MNQTRKNYLAILHYLVMSEELWLCGKTCFWVGLLNAVYSVYAVNKPTIMFILFCASWDNFLFTTKWNEAWLLVINWYMPVASRVAKWLKTAGNINIRKSSKFHSIIA